MVTKVHTRNLKGNNIVFDTVADLTAYTAFDVGDLVITKGYYSIGDGGGASYLITAGNTGDTRLDHDVLSNTATLQPVNNAIDMLQGGAISDGGVTQNTIKPISDYANARRLDVTLENTFSTRMHFTDSFHLLDTKLISKSGGHLFYKGGNQQLLPAITLGNSLDDAYPSFFESNKPFLVGETLAFSGGSLGEVMFVIDGKVYYKWFPNDTVSFPTSGSVAGRASNEGEVLSPSTTGQQVFGPPRNAGAENIYVACDSLPSDHIQATGVLINGCRDGRSFGKCGSITVEDFSVGICLIFNWFLTVSGTLEVNGCADGILMSYDNNAMHIDRLILVSGTSYDSVVRYRLRMPYSYSNTISVLDIEGGAGESYVDFSGSHGITVNSGDIEGNPDFSTILLKGFAGLDEFTDPEGDEAQRIRLGAVTLNGLRFHDSLGILFNKYTDGVTLSNMYFDYPVAGTTIPLVWESVVNTNDAGFDIRGLKLTNITASHFDVAASFRMTGDMSQAKVMYDESNYNRINYDATFYKPAAQNLLAMRVALGETVRYTVDSISVYSQTGGTHTMTFQVLQDNDIGLSNAIALTGGTYYEDTSTSGPYVTTEDLTVRLTSISDAADNNYTFRAEIVELTLN